jgi:hypothetical protein
MAPPDTALKQDEWIRRIMGGRRVSDAVEVHSPGDDQHPVAVPVSSPPPREPVAEALSPTVLAETPFSQRSGNRPQTNTPQSDAPRMMLSPPQSTDHHPIQQWPHQLPPPTFEQWLPFSIEITDKGVTINPVSKQSPTWTDQHSAPAAETEVRQSEGGSGRRLSFSERRRTLSKTHIRISREGGLEILTEPESVGHDEAEQSATMEVVDGADSGIERRKDSLDTVTTRSFGHGTSVTRRVSSKSDGPPPLGVELLLSPESVTRLDDDVGSFPEQDEDIHSPSSVPANLTSNFFAQLRDGPRPSALPAPTSTLTLVVDTDARVTRPRAKRSPKKLSLQGSVSRASSAEALPTVAVTAPAALQSKTTEAVAPQSASLSSTPAVAPQSASLSSTPAVAPQAASLKPEALPRRPSRRAADPDRRTSPRAAAHHPRPTPRALPVVRFNSQASVGSPVRVSSRSDVGLSRGPGGLR